MTAVAADDALCAWVWSHRDELVDFVRTLVRERSVLGGEAAIQGLVDARLRLLGRDIRHVRPQEGGLRGDGLGAPMLPYQERTCVVGRLEGTGGGRDLHLSGHVDVVPVDAADLWTHDPWGGEISGGRLYGRGAGDMKAGLAAYLFGLQALLEVTGPPPGNVLFSSVIDEECGGNGMRAVMDTGLRSIATLIGEPTDLRAEHGGVGVISAQLTVRASGGHAALKSSSPIDELLEGLEGLRGLERALNAGLPDHPYNLNVGEIHAGVWPSSVPDRAVARVRLGFGPELSPREAQTCLAATVACAAPNAIVEFLGFAAEPYRHEPAGELADVLADAHRRLRGEPLAFAVSRATCDARFVDGPAYCFGPRAGNIHGIDEWVDLDSVIDTAASIAIVAHAWCGARDEAA